MNIPEVQICPGYKKTAGWSQTQSLLHKWTFIWRLQCSTKSIICCDPPVVFPALPLPSCYLLYHMFHHIPRGDRMYAVFICKWQPVIARWVEGKEGKEGIRRMETGRGKEWELNDIQWKRCHLCLGTDVLSKYVSIVQRWNRKNWYKWTAKHI